MDQCTSQESQEVSMEGESNERNHSLLKDLRDLAETDAEIEQCHSTIANLTKSLLHLSKDIKIIEQVQRRATKLIGILRELPYEDILRAPNHTTLALRRVVEENRLEEKWCYHKSKRIRPHPESEASRIAVQLGEHPHLTDDVITELQKKKVSLTLEVARLKDELKQSSVS